MYAKVLIPVDGSDVSSHAAAEGLELARSLGSSLTFQYVVDMAVASLPESEMGISNLEIIRASFLEQGKKVIEGLKSRADAAGVKADAVISEGDVHDEIIKLAEDRAVDLIVMGTHGRRGLNRLLLGSVAESVSRRAHCAVLLIRP